MRSQRGFTLIEILITAAILGIICSIAARASYSRILGRYELEHSAG